ncbi:class II aldolase/adducin family protein [Devosia sp. A449]
MADSTAPTRLAAAYQRLAELRLIVGAEGNISKRTDQGMTISVTGTRVGNVQAGSFVESDFAGSTTDGRKPSSEWAMHAAIYQAFPNAGAIVHTHSDACVALAVQNRTLPAFHYQMARFGGGDVRCTPYVLFGTAELATAAVEALAGRKACLLGNHGMICYGRTLAEALASAEVLETLARQYILACSSGVPLLLNDAQIAEVMTRFASYASG